MVWHCHTLVMESEVGCLDFIPLNCSRHLPPKGSPQASLTANRKAQLQSFFLIFKMVRYSFQTPILFGAWREVGMTSSDVEDTYYLFLSSYMITFYNYLQGLFGLFGIARIVNVERRRTAIVVTLVLWHKWRNLGQADNISPVDIIWKKRQAPRFLCVWNGSLSISHKKLRDRFVYTFWLKIHLIISVIFFHNLIPSAKYEFFLMNALSSGSPVYFMICTISWECSYVMIQYILKR